MAFSTSNDFVQDWQKRQLCAKFLGRTERHIYVLLWFTSHQMHPNPYGLFHLYKGNWSNHDTFGQMNIMNPPNPRYKQTKTKHNKATYIFICYTPNLSESRD